MRKEKPQPKDQDPVEVIEIFFIVLFEEYCNLHHDFNNRPFLWNMGVSAS